MSIPPGPSIVFLADVGSLRHIGDEAMLDANRQQLERLVPAASVTVLGRSAERAEMRAALAHADGAFLSGGGNLSSSWPALLEQRIVFLAEAHAGGVRAVAGGQTIGPVLDAEHRDALTRALSTVALLGARDLPSLALARGLGMEPSGVVLQADDAYLLKARQPDFEPPAEPYLAVTLDASLAADAVALTNLAGQLAGAARRLAFAVLLIPHVESAGADDVTVAAMVADRLAIEAVPHAVAPVCTPAEVAWLTQRAVAVVSSRYHPLVFASAAGVPSVGIHRDAYTRIKVEGALAHAGMGAWALSGHDAEAGALGVTIERLCSDRDTLRAAMFERRSLIEQREEQRWQRILAALGIGPIVGAAPDFGWPGDELAAVALDALEAERRSAESAAHRATAESLLRRGSDRLAARREPNEGPAHAPALVIPDEDWDLFWRQGFLHLGQVLEPEEVEALKERADDLASGAVRNDHVLMQLDTGGAYEDLPEAVPSLEGETTMYRKIQGLEQDDRFAGLVCHPVHMEVCGRIYGRHVPISIFRAMVMNKPAGQGTHLPWHQDGGDVWALDRDPLVTIWVALDPATTANGCMDAVVGSHRLGLLTAQGSNVSDAHAEEHCRPERVAALEVPSGHAILLHNWLIHRSGVNRSAVPRRAFTACYMDGRTQSTLTGDHFPIIAGSIASEPHPFVRQLEDDRAAQRESNARAVEYALSLEAEVEALRAARAEAETYARSLEEHVRGLATQPATP